jgi:hypothetical protein
MFSGLLNKHQGEEAYLFTKGVSFDDYDQDQAGDLRIAINDACEHVDKPTYCVSFWADGSKFKLPKGCVLLNGKTEEGKNVTSRQQKSVDTFVPQALPLFFQYSTLSLALSYLSYMGVSVIHLIGCDPGRYSPRFGGAYGGAEYEGDALLIQQQTRNLVIDMAEKAGITMYDYGRN